MHRSLMAILDCPFNIPTAFVAVFSAAMTEMPFIKEATDVLRLERSDLMKHVYIYFKC